MWTGLFMVHSPYVCAGEGGQRAMTSRGQSGFVQAECGLGHGQKCQEVLGGSRDAHLASTPDLHTRPHSFPPLSP